MTQPKQISFDSYLDAVFASSDWLDACVNMLSAFLETVDAWRDDPGQSMPDSAPAIIDQVAAVAERAQRLQLQLRHTAERRGPEFRTPELGAVLWWAGMASHKAAGAAESICGKMARNAWEDAFYELHALMYDTISAVSLLSIAEGMVQRMEAERTARARPN